LRELIQSTIVNNTEQRDSGPHYKLRLIITGRNNIDLCQGTVLSPLLEPVQKSRMRMEFAVMNYVFYGGTYSAHLGLRHHGFSFTAANSKYPIYPS
ncbi:hypothetical protein J6590_090469, partial [Homalodisca vitripennis]